MRLQFMQSSRRPDRCALVSRARTRSCRARRAASSAPSEVSRLAGFDRIIGFDMGGTSTDVTHWAGEYERAFVTEVAGVRLRAPMMMHPLRSRPAAARSARSTARAFASVPQSAGANPGPASYRRGGPLTVTDCNVMVGKIDPELFPTRVRDRRPAAARRAASCGQSLPRLPPRSKARTGVVAHRPRRSPKASADRRREHGQRDQAHLGAARLRRHRVHAVLFRRRWRAARVPASPTRSA